MQFNVISEIYFENYTTTAINSSYSYKIGCRMEAVRRNFEAPQHDSKDQYAGWTLELLDFLTSPSSDIWTTAKHFGKAGEGISRKKFPQFSATSLQNGTDHQRSRRYALYTLLHVPGCKVHHHIHPHSHPHTNDTITFSVPSPTPATHATVFPHT
jgi:hypothetical protein